MKLKIEEDSNFVQVEIRPSLFLEKFVRSYLPVAKFYRKNMVLLTHNNEQFPLSIRVYLIFSPLLYPLFYSKFYLFHCCNNNH